jgi:hypothetical protein
MIIIGSLFFAFGFITWAYRYYEPNFTDAMLLRRTLV